jgi:O-antigen ligase
LVSAGWMRLALTGIIFLNIAAIVMTYSRGAAVSLLIVFVFVTWHARHKMVLVLLLVLMTGPAVYLVGNTYLERMQTISVDNADASIQSRNEYRRAAFEMWKDHPLFGVGFGSANFQALLSRYVGRADQHVVHNTYMQMLVDSGIFAFLIYVSLLFGCIIGLERSALRIRDVADGLEVYPLAIAASLAGFAAGSFFLSRVSFDFVYILIMAAASWGAVEATRAAEAESHAVEESMPA